MGGWLSEYQPLGARKGARKGPKNGFDPLKILFWPRLDVGSSLGIKIHILTNFHDFSLKNGRDSFSRTSDAYVNLSLFLGAFFAAAPPSSGVTGSFAREDVRALRPCRQALRACRHGRRAIQTRPVGGVRALYMGFDPL